MTLKTHGFRSTTSPSARKSSLSNKRSDEPSPPQHPWLHLIGHKKNQDRWHHLVNRGKLPSVLLLVGREGVGKEGLLAYLTGLLYCQHHNACGQCPSCFNAMKGNHSEILWALGQNTHMKSENTETSGVRAGSYPPLLLEDASQIQDHLNLAPGLEGNYRCVVIPDAERLSLLAANRLLKTLEEPPPHTFVFMSTSRIEHILPTILSRSVRWHITPPPKNESLLFLSQTIPPSITVSNDIVSELLDLFGLAPGPVFSLLQTRHNPSEHNESSHSLASSDQKSEHRGSDADTMLSQLTQAYLNDCMHSLQTPDPMGALSMARIWGKQLSCREILDGFEKALNRHYRRLFHSPSKPPHLDPVAINKRRELLSQGRRLAIKNKIPLNTTLLIEAITQH